MFSTGNLRLLPCGTDTDLGIFLGLSLWLCRILIERSPHFSAFSNIVSTRSLYTSSGPDTEFATKNTLFLWLPVTSIAAFLNRSLSCSGFFIFWTSSSNVMTVRMVITVTNVKRIQIHD